MLLGDLEDATKPSVKYFGITIESKINFASGFNVLLITPLEVADSLGCQN